MAKPFSTCDSLLWTFQREVPSSRSQCHLGNTVTTSSDPAKQKHNETI